MSSSKQYQTLSLVAAINYLNANRYNQVAISRELGVTPLQVYYYGIGKTKAPKAEICMRFYTKFNILLDLILVKVNDVKKSRILYYLWY